MKRMKKEVFLPLVAAFLLVSCGGEAISSSVSEESTSSGVRPSVSSVLGRFDHGGLNTVSFNLFPGNYDGAASLPTSATPRLVFSYAERGFYVTPDADTGWDASFGPFGYVDVKDGELSGVPAGTYRAVPAIDLPTGLLEATPGNYYLSSFVSDDWQYYSYDGSTGFLGNENRLEAASLTLAPMDGGFSLSFEGGDGTTSYLGIEEGNASSKLSLLAEAFAWSLDGEGNIVADGSYLVYDGQRFFVDEKPGDEGAPRLYAEYPIPYDLEASSYSSAYDLFTPQYLSEHAESLAQDFVAGTSSTISACFETDTISLFAKSLGVDQAVKAVVPGFVYTELDLTYTQSSSSFNYRFYGCLDSEAAEDKADNEFLVATSILNPNPQAAQASVFASLFGE